VPSITTYTCPALLVSRSAVRSFGDRAASRPTVSVTYRQAVVVPIPNPAASPAKVSPLRRQASTSSACWPQVSLRQHEPILRRWRRMTPAVSVRVWRDNGSAAGQKSMEAPRQKTSILINRVIHQGRPLLLLGAEGEGGAGTGRPAGRAERAGDRDDQASQREEDDLPGGVHRDQ
jgi:hypothetical protein